MHLSPEAFIECLDDQGKDRAQRHLQACAACRAELAQLRASMAALLDVDVPDPSPLFWGHLSARVRDAVAAEAPPRRSWLDVLTQPGGWGWPVWPAVATAVALVGFLALPQRHTPLAPAPDASVAGAVEIPWTQPTG
jgi:hypothetical protein